MTKQEKLNVYNDCKRGVESIIPGEYVEFYYPGSVMAVEKEQHYYYVNGEEVIKTPEITALAFKHVLKWGK